MWPQGKRVPEEHIRSAQAPARPRYAAAACAHPAHLAWRRARSPPDLARTSSRAGATSVVRQGRRERDAPQPVASQSELCMDPMARSRGSRGHHRCPAVPTKRCRGTSSCDRRRGHAAVRDAAPRRATARWCSWSEPSSPAPAGITSGALQGPSPPTCPSGCGRSATSLAPSRVLNWQRTQRAYSKRPCAGCAQSWRRIF